MLIFYAEFKSKKSYTKFEFDKNFWKFYGDQGKHPTTTGWYGSSTNYRIPGSRGTKIISKLSFPCLKTLITKKAKNPPTAGTEPATSRTVANNPNHSARTDIDGRAQFSVLRDRALSKA